MDDTRRYKLMPCAARRLMAIDRHYWVTAHTHTFTNTNKLRGFCAFVQCTTIELAKQARVVDFAKRVIFRLMQMSRMRARSNSLSTFSIR